MSTQMPSRNLCRVSAGRPNQFVNGSIRLGFENHEVWYVAWPINIIKSKCPPVELPGNRLLQWPQSLSNLRDLWTDLAEKSERETSTNHEPEQIMAAEERTERERERRTHHTVITNTCTAALDVCVYWSSNRHYQHILNCSNVLAKQSGQYSPGEGSHSVHQPCLHTENLIDSCIYVWE